MAKVPAEQLAEVFVEVADTLVDEFDVVEFLHVVAVRTANCGGAPAAGLLLTDERGQLQLMAASDERTHMLELFQIQAKEGPCHDCFDRREAVVNADLLGATEQWPRFVPRALAAGFRSVHAFPLRLRREVIGALNLFGDEPGTMEPDDVRVIQALADVATIGILQERTIRRSEVLTEQLQAALNSRIVVEQAKGALAHIHDETTDQAFNRLRSYARNHGLRLGDLAFAVVHDPASVPDLTH
jgi:transcriptional regulator with GAF, ATPase, and Fis domain